MTSPVYRIRYPTAIVTPFTEQYYVLSNAYECANLTLGTYLYSQCKYIAFVHIILSLAGTYGVSGIHRRSRASRKSEFSRCTTIRRCTAARWRCCSSKSSIACKTSHDRIFRTANRSVPGQSDRLWDAKRTVIITFIDYYHSNSHIQNYCAYIPLCVKHGKKSYIRDPPLQRTIPFQLQILYKQLTHKHNNILKPKMSTTTTIIQLHR